MKPLPNFDQLAILYSNIKWLRIGTNSEPVGSDAAGLAREEEASVRMEEG